MPRALVVGSWRRLLPGRLFEHRRQAPGVGDPLLQERMVGNAALAQFVNLPPQVFDFAFLRIKAGLGC
jgi:hypothetical protein